MSHHLPRDADGPAALPSYSFVPGLFPHPHSDPAGHRFGQALPAPECPDPAAWRASPRYVLGLELFNDGYYWEAHEMWEALWHACGRRGVTATFLKGLIQLAVVGVKVREGRTGGVVSHARRGAELFREVLGQLSAGERQFMGQDAASLAVEAERVAEQPPIIDESQRLARVAVVFEFSLAQD